MKVCLYARVACSDQLALDRQVKKLKAFAGEHDINVVDAAADFGSGIRADRPELTRVEALAAEGKIDAVVMTDISRLFRSAPLYFEFARRMQDCGVKIFELDRLQRLL